MIYPGSQESQDKRSSQNIRPGEGTKIHDQETMMGDDRNGVGAPDAKEVEEDDWLRIFEDEIAASSRAAIEGAPSAQEGGAREHATARDATSSAHNTQGSDTGSSSAVEGTSRGRGTVLRERFTGHRSLRRLGLMVERLKSGFANWRRGFATLPRRSQRWVLIAGIAGVSAILWGVFAPSGQGSRSASASELLAQAQMSNSLLERQVQNLNGELQGARKEREQLRNEVDALTEERDWLAARLDAVASAGAPVIDGTAPPSPTPPAANSIASSTSEKTDVPSAGDYEVARGDTLWSIAHRHNADVKQLAAANGIGPSDPLKLGQRLVIPDEGSPSAAESEGSAEKGTTEEVATSSGSKARQVEYTVKRGDSLYGISRQFGVSVEQLQAWNSLGKGEVLRPSQRLIVNLDGAADSRALP
ncbi:MAG: LysM peptidoglycan-binding domain-containing protein [Gammaproteobacteria bacterium]